MWSSDAPCRGGEAFFDASLTPKLPIEEYTETFDTNGAVGIWPPEGIKTFDPLDVPFLNTLILLMSGTTCTWAHHAVREGHRDQAIQALWFTVGLGIFFTFMQGVEYYEAALHYLVLQMEFILQFFIWQLVFTGFT